MSTRPVRFAAFAVLAALATATVACSEEERAPAIDPSLPRTDGGGFGDGAVRPDTGAIDSGAKSDGATEASTDATDGGEAADVSIEDAADDGG